MDKTLEATHIEAQDEPKPQIMGNVKLLQDGETVLVPTPSPDPNGKSDVSEVLRSQELTRYHRPFEPALMAQMGYSHSRRSVRLLRRRPGFRIGTDLHIDSGLVPWAGIEGERPPDLSHTIYGSRKRYSYAIGDGHRTTTHFFGFYPHHGRRRHLVRFLEELGHAYCRKKHHVPCRWSE